MTKNLKNTKLRLYHWEERGKPAHHARNEVGLTVIGKKTPLLKLQQEGEGGGGVD